MADDRLAQHYLIRSLALDDKVPYHTLPLASFSVTHLLIVIHW